MKQECRCKFLEQKEALKSFPKRTHRIEKGVASPLNSNTAHNRALRNSFKIHSFLFLFCFLGPHLQHMEAPRQGSNQSCSRRPMPQPQQHRIQASSVTYTTAQGNAKSLTHWARPRIRPMSSWMLVKFISTAPHQELHNSFFQKWLRSSSHGSAVMNPTSIHEDAVLIPDFAVG